MQIRMEANQKYIDTILEKAFKIVSEQLSGMSISDHDLSDPSSAGIMCSPADPLSSSVFHQLSVFPGGKAPPSDAVDGHLFFEKPPELKRKLR